MDPLRIGPHPSHPWAAIWAPVDPKGGAAQQWGCSLKGNAAQLSVNTSQALRSLHSASTGLDPVVSTAVSEEGDHGA